MALISPQAEVLDTGVIFPTFQTSKSSSGRDKSTVLSLASKHGLDLISIGNGNGCRDVEKWVASILSDGSLQKHVQVIYFNLPKISEMLKNRKHIRRTRHFFPSPFILSPLPL